MNKVNSKYIIQIIFNHINLKKKLEILKYNKNLQKK